MAGYLGKFVQLDEPENFNGHDIRRECRVVLVPEAGGEESRVVEDVSRDATPERDTEEMRRYAAIMQEVRKNLKENVGSAAKCIHHARDLAAFPPILTL
jgi:hypothetical protein